jgi:carboxymethylenebutenolidase
MKDTFLFLFSLCLALSATAQDFAIAQLEKSTRHHEWAVVQQGERAVHCFVAYPEKPRNTPVFIVIHENRGLTDWVRSMADQLAGAGYLAVAPDLLSGFSPERSRTSDFANSDEARDAIYQLDPAQVAADLNQVYQYAASLPSSNGKVAVIGFCWGGSQAFRMATYHPDIVAALPFYGTAPKDAAAFEGIRAPVYGFYGENDQRVNATIPETAQMMTAAGKAYQYEIYPGAGHAYMRYADEPGASKANRKAKKKSMKRIRKIMAAWM